MIIVLGIVIWLLVSAAAAYWACQHVNARLASAATAAEAGAPLSVPAQDKVAAATGAAASLSVCTEEVSAEQPADESAAPDSAKLEPAGTELAIDSKPAATEHVEAEPAAPDPAVLKQEIDSESATPLSSWSSTPYVWNGFTKVLAALVLVLTIAVAIVSTITHTADIAFSPSIWACTLIGYAGVLAAALIDAKLRIIPNVIPIVMIAARLPLFLIQFAILSSDKARAIFAGAVVGLIAPFVILGVAALITHGGIGGGDVKLISALGFDCGIYAVITSLIASLAIFTLVALALLVSRRRKWSDSLAFAPFYYAGLSLVFILATY